MNILKTGSNSCWHLNILLKVITCVPTLNNSLSYLSSKPTRPYFFKYRLIDLPIYSSCFLNIGSLAYRLLIKYRTGDSI